jgi:hypothetical protein
MTNYDWNKYGYLLHCTHLKMIYFVFKIAFGYCLRIKKILRQQKHIRQDNKWRDKIVFNISIQDIMIIFISYLVMMNMT